MASAQAMDQMYRYQRYIYDFTRKYYLLGRDRLIRHLPIKLNSTTIEIGCGTGRNLMLAAKQYPQGRFFGIDASEEMLKTARQKIAHLPMKIELRQGLAEELNYQDFHIEQGFDIVFFSYTLSMIPNWQSAVDAALRNLKPNGDLYIVDFSQQSRLPHWFAKALQAWLARFGVFHDPELIHYLRELHNSQQGQLTIEDIGWDYGFLAHFHRLGT